MARRILLLSGFVPALLMSVALMALGSVWIWQGGVRDEVERLRSERFRFSLLHLKATLEAGLRLGNAVNDLGGTPDLIAQVRDHQPDILSVDVYGPQGEVVYSTDTGGLGASLPAEWAESCLAGAAQEPWAGQDVDGGVQCVGLLNAFGQPAGGVLLRHRWSVRATQGLTVPTEWPWMLAGGVLLMLLMAVWAARQMQPLELAARQLRQRLETGEGGPVNGDLAAPERIDAALQALQAQEQSLEQTDAEADRLDRQEAA